MTSIKLDTRPIAGSLGAEIHGVDLRAPVGESLRRALRAALLKHLVLFFPGKRLLPEELKTFGTTWGELVTYGNAPPSGEAPDVVEHVASRGDTADMWHSDVTFMANPAMIAVLSMVKLPAVGGDTMWSNQYDAYERLSAPMRELLDGLTALHQFPADLIRPDRPATLKTMEHPVVRVHPETGRRHLFVNSLYTKRIVQLSSGESNALLSYLYTHATDPRFTLRYQWSEGTVAVWDNRCTQHMVVNDFDGERVVQRVTAGTIDYDTPNSRWEQYHPSRRSLTAKLDEKETATVA